MRRRAFAAISSPLSAGLLASALLFFCASPANAANLFAEDFEGLPTGDVTLDNQANKDLAARGWDVRANCTGYCTMAIVDAPSGRTGKVLRYEYREPNQESIPVPAQDAHNANLVYTFPSGGLTELYGREYVRYDVNKTGDPTATESKFFTSGYKHHYLRVNQGPSYIAGQHFYGEREASFGTQELADCNPVYKGGPGCAPLFSNMQQIPLNDGAWHCIEYHLKLNSSPTAADGAFEFWVDEKQTLGSYNRKMYDGFYDLEGSKIRWVEVYRQHSSVMYRYEDDLVWSTSRVGCGGSVGNNGGNGAGIDGGIDGTGGNTGAAEPNPTSPGNDAAAGPSGQGGVTRYTPSPNESGCSVQARGTQARGTTPAFGVGGITAAAALIACRLWRVAQRKRLVKTRR